MKKESDVYFKLPVPQERRRNKEENKVCYCITFSKKNKNIGP
jgi:hypothetical protein